MPMPSQTPPSTPTTQSTWETTTTALVGGLTVASFMFYLLAAVQTPGLDPPPESVALFLVATTVAAISYLLLRAGNPLGYPASILAGVVVFAVVAALVVGVYGPPGPDTNPIGPAVYLALAAAVVVTAVRAWRSRETTRPTTASSTR